MLFFGWDSGTPALQGPLDFAHLGNSITTPLSLTLTYDNSTSIIRRDTYVYHQAGRAIRCNIPISCLDPLYSTRVLQDRRQDCGSSSLLPHDSHQDSVHYPMQIQVVREVYLTTTLDTFFHSQSYSVFPCTCTQVVLRSVYILNKVRIHAFADLAMYG